MPSLLLKTSLLLHKSYLRGKSPPVPPPAWLLRERLILVLSTSKVSACHPKRSMLGGNGYCIPMAFGMPGMVSALFSASQQASQEFPHSKSKLRAACPKDTPVEISADLMQYLSAEDLNNMWGSADCHKASLVAAAHLTTCTSIVASRCSTHSNQMVSDQMSPMSTPPQQQQPPCKRCRIECSGDCSDSCSDTTPSSSPAAAAAAAPQPSSSAASSSSTGSAQDVLLTAAASDDSLPSTSGSPSSSSPSSCSSSLAYADEFVWQCYYGDPACEANKQQQRPKQTSPFAVFASFPSYDL